MPGLVPRAVDVDVRCSQASTLRSPEDFKAQLADRNALAPSLVGLDRDAAVERSRDYGFDPESIPVSVTVSIADLAANRISLLLDEDEIVVRAWGG